MKVSAACPCFNCPTHLSESYTLLVILVQLYSFLTINIVIGPTVITFSTSSFFHFKTCICLLRILTQLI